MQGAGAWPAKVADDERLFNLSAACIVHAAVVANKGTPGTYLVLPSFYRELQ